MVTIRFRGALFDGMLKISPEVYMTYVINDKKCNNILILRYLKAIYGKIVESLLYHQKFCNTLSETGFKLNPYNTCVNNRMVNGKQQSIFCQVGDYKLSHMDPKFNEKFVEVLKQEYVRIFEDG